jgi:hypothetical protein
MLRAASMKSRMSSTIRIDSGVRVSRLMIFWNDSLMRVASPEEKRPSVSSQKMRLLTMSNGASGSFLLACRPMHKAVQPTPPGPTSSTEFALLRIRIDDSFFSSASRPTSLKFGTLAR